MVRVTVGVEAHTHEYIATAHEDQKFGFSLAGGQADEAVRRILEHPDRLSLRGLHSHIGSQIFDVSGFEVAARRVLDLRLRVAREHGVELPELDLGGGFGIAYTTQHDPLPPADLAAGMADIVGRTCRADGVSVPRISIEPGRAIAGPSTFTLYEVGTVKEVLLDGNASRTYVAVDGGMSDNVRPALYDADYSCTVANRVSRRAAGPRPGGRQALRERRHRRQGRVRAVRHRAPATCSPSPAPAPTAAACPASTTTSRARRWSRSATGRRGVIVRRETIEDLLAPRRRLSGLRPAVPPGHRAPARHTVRMAEHPEFNRWTPGRMRACFRRRAGVEERA